MKSRKIEMTKLNVAALVVITIGYLGVCGYLKIEPSSTFMLAACGVLGVGHGTGNWANAKEHQAKNNGNVETLSDKLKPVDS